MSSRVFEAKTGHTESKPQLCGLSNNPISKGDQIMYLVCRGEDARPEYQIKVTREEKKQVTYRGRPKTIFEKDYGMDDGKRFRSVFGGWQMNHDTGKREKIFTWQEYKGLDADGEEIWNPVKCWSHIVFAQIAADLGYEVRCNKKGKWKTTTARDGDRAIGSEHTIDAEGENAMEVLARAVCSDEELGLVAPSEPEDSLEDSLEDSVEEILSILERTGAEARAEREEIIREENEAIGAAMNAEAEAEEERLDAEALGMTLEQYRRVLANQNG